MEHVKEIIQKAMPSLRSDLVKSLMSRLELIGVNCVDDLSFVKTEDVEGILPPIQCRRLIQAFSVGNLPYFYCSCNVNIIKMKLYNTC